MQRLKSPALGFSSLVHFLGLSSFAASFKFNEAYGWHFQYLTIIGLLLATLSFTFGSLADITSSQRLFRLKNAFSLVATPLEVLVSILYGGLTLVDKELVIPQEFQMGLLPDIGFHALPALVLTIDFLFLSPPWTISSRQALIMSTTFAFAYWFWVEQCYRHNGWYPYPIFAALTTPWRIVLFTFSGALMTASMETLKLVYSKLNGSDSTKK
ncbi:MAG: hypothetical protein L6R37_003894 [Teloschistes peruensis]|nr:MAG: hypothetical protein L6R37_003894 [Teloschistes peruensis]